MNKLKVLLNESNKVLLIQGSTLEIELRFRYEGTSIAYTLSGASVKMYVRKTDEQVLELSAIVTAGGSGVAKVSISAADSALLKIANNQNVEFKITNPDSSIKYAQVLGALDVLPRLLAS